MNELQTSASSSVDGLLGEILDDFLRRQSRGEQPDAEEYAARFPQVATILREMLPPLQGMVDSTGNLAAPAAALTPPGYAPGYLGDYRIVREVGRGGMGVVYEAEQVSLGRKVALKVLPFAAAMDARHLQRFKNEAQAVAQLHHQHIVAVYGVGCERGTHYYAMQYIEGPTVAALIHELVQRRQPPGGDATASAAAPAEGHGRAVPDTGPIAALPTAHSAGSPTFFRTVAQLGVQAAEALEHAHELGVVHRDIKPANLLVNARGHLWVTDFGLARLPNDLGLTLTGDLLGTLRYMSPEQALAQHGLVDHRTDIYSLGATLYELLTLQPACPGKDRQEVLRQIENDEPLPPKRLCPAVPADLETIVLKTLAKDLESRYATAQALANDLRRFLEDKPIQARRPSAWQRTRKWVRRHQGMVVTAVVAGVLVLLTAVVALAVGFTQVRVEQQRTAEEHDRKERSFDLASRALERCLKHVDRDLASLRWGVLEAEEDFLREFVQLRGSEPHFQVERAKAYMKLASITGKLNTRDGATGKLSTKEKPIGYYREARSVLVPLVQEHPSVPQYRELLAQCHHELGVLHLHLQRWGPAENVLHEALALRKALVNEHPEVAEYQHGVAATHAALGFVYEHSDRHGEAEQAYQESRTLHQRLAHEQPGVAEYQLDVVAGSGRLGHLYRRMGRSQDAERTYQEAHSLCHALVEADPENASYRQALAGTQSNLGFWYLETNRVRKAAQAHHEALRLLEDLHRAQPHQTQYAVDLGLTRINLGRLAERTGQPEPALAWQTRAVETLEAVFNKAPDNARAQFHLGRAYDNQFRILNALGRDEEALRVLDRWLERLPGTPQAEFACFERAKTLARLRRYAEATAAAAELLKLPGIDTGKRVRCAEVYSLAYAAHVEDPVRAEPYAAQAVALLRQAIAHGYQDAAALKTHGDFEALRQRSDFQELLAAMEQRQESDQP